MLSTFVQIILNDFVLFSIISEWLLYSLKLNTGCAVKAERSWLVSAYT